MLPSGGTREIVIKTNRPKTCAPLLKVIFRSIANRKDITECKKRKIYDYELRDMAEVIKTQKSNDLYSLKSRKYIVDNILEAI